MKEFDCRKCGLPHAPDAKQLCLRCAHEEMCERRDRIMREECNAAHKRRQQFVAMFGGNRHFRRRSLKVGRQ